MFVIICFVLKQMVSRVVHFFSLSVFCWSFEYDLYFGVWKVVTLVSKLREINHFVIMIVFDF